MLCLCNYVHKTYFNLLFSVCAYFAVKCSIRCATIKYLKFKNVYFLYCVSENYCYFTGRVWNSRVMYFTFYLLKADIVPFVHHSFIFVNSNFENDFKKSCQWFLQSTSFLHLRENLCIEWTTEKNPGVSCSVDRNTIQLKNSFWELDKLWLL